MDRLTKIATDHHWTLVDTGGGCTALRYDDENRGRFYLVTDNGGSHAPAWGDELYIGEYDAATEGEGDEQLRAWTVLFRSDCDGNDTEGYVIEHDDVELFDPTSGIGSQLGMPVNPESEYGIAVPVAILLSALYNVELDDEDVESLADARAEADTDWNARREVQMIAAALALIEAIRESAPADGAQAWRAGWNANADRLWTASAALRAFVMPTAGPSDADIAAAAALAELHSGEPRRRTDGEGA